MAESKHEKGNQLSAGKGPSHRSSGWGWSVAGLVLPPVFALVVFAMAVGLVIIPFTREAMMDRKRELIRAIVASATGILEQNANLEAEGRMTRAEAQESAKAYLRVLRYGEDNKDYLWIIDREPRMIMHPYRPELENQPMGDFKDAHGKRLFTEAVRSVSASGEGYVDYMWQWKDDPTRIVPKLSFVREFKTWGWIVGSGIYLDDVHREIAGVTRRITHISAGAGLVLALLLTLGIARGWRSERLRRKAEAEVARSRERYVALAHASGELVVLSFDGKIAGANRSACDILGRTESQLCGEPLSSLFANSSDCQSMIAAGLDETSREREVFLSGKSGPVPVILTATKATVHGEPALLIAGRCLMADHYDGSDNLDVIAASCGLGLIRIQAGHGGNILFADDTAVRILTHDDGKQPVGLPIADLIADGYDIKALLSPSDSRKPATSLVLRSRVPGKFVLRAWIAEDNRSENRSGSCSVLLSDISTEERSRAATDAALTDLVATRAMAASSDNAGLSAESTLKSRAIFRAMISTGMDPERVTSAISRTYDAILVRAASETVAQLGPPPCPAALLAVGSLGRAEPTLTADQDTCLVIADTASAARDNSWFDRFAEAVTRLADTAGLAACRAGNTTANPKWRQPMRTWQRQFDTWIQDGSPEDLLAVNIFFDFRHVWGDATMAALLRQHIFKTVSDRPVFLYRMAKDTIDFKTPLDILGRIRSDDPVSDSIDLKGVMLHFVSFARIYALRHGIHATSTATRLRTLVDAGHLPQDLTGETIDAWRFLLGLRLLANAAEQTGIAGSGNSIIPGLLSGWQLAQLKRALTHVSSLQHRMSTDITAGT